MRILSLQTLRGPNDWSIRRPKLIEMQLDLQAMDEVFSDTIPGFYDGLVAALPSLIDHACSPGYRGGFFERVKDGTLMGHVIEHVALELQSLAGMTVDFGRTRRGAVPGVYRVVFEYQAERAGRYAGRAAFRLVESLIDRGDYPAAELARDLDDLRELWADELLGPTTEALVDEAIARNIPWMELPTRRVVQFGYGVHQKRVQAAQTNHTSMLAIELAGDKESTIRLLRSCGLPVPQGEVVYHIEDLMAAIAAIEFPIVIKPLDGNHGRGITLNITNWRDAEAAYYAAKREAKSGIVMVERFYRGNDYRVLVVDGKVVAVAERVPAHVIGDGRSTVAELVTQTNRDPRRGRGHENMLTRITIDVHSEQVLDQQGYTQDSIPAKGAICYLKATANLSTGGVAIDRTDVIHPENVWIAERAAKTIGLDIAGIDITAPAIDRPLRELDGVIVEVNAAPGLRMHLQPSEGTPRNVAAPILAMLYPDGQPSRIPIVAITGTSHKTLATRLVAHVLRQCQQVVGYTTAEGIFIGDFPVIASHDACQRDRLILQDPTVEAAVFETAIDDILRAGLAYDQCDVGVVLNVADDDPTTDRQMLDEAARVMSVVAEATSPTGFVVLNAEDPHVVAMANRVKATAVYFSTNPWNPVVWSHVRDGGVAAIYEDGDLNLLTQNGVITVEQVTQIPLIWDGSNPAAIAIALAATLTAYVSGMLVPDISTALRTFQAVTPALETAPLSLDTGLDPVQTHAQARQLQRR